MVNSSQSQYDRLEQRISALEEENRKLKTQLRQSSEAGQYTITRRKALAGLLSGGALIGAASQPTAAATTMWDDSDNDSLLESPNYEGIDVTTVDTGQLSIGNAAVQTSLDGYVVPVGQGLSAADAVDPSTTTTPIQDAINLVDSTGIAVDSKVNGAGGILLPPGVIETPGNIYGLGGKRLLGWGRQSSVVRVTDPTANGFSLNYAANRHMIHLDGFAIDGGDRANRTAGSAINFGATTSDADTSGETSVGASIGQLYFLNWGGSDPVIASLGVFSNYWRYLRGENYDGSFLKMGGFDHTIEKINVNHGSFNTPVIDLSGPGGGYRIGSVNIGGNVGRALRLDKVNSRYAYFELSYLNIEPDQDGAGTLTSAPAPVELLGASPVRIRNISQDGRLTSDHTVYLAGSTDYAGSANDGPGRNWIGEINYTDASTGRPIAVGASPDAPSYYFGPRHEIDYGGYNPRSVIPIGAGDGYATAAKITLGNDHTLSGDSSYYTLPFSGAMYDYGENFDPGAHQYTAPQRGIYSLGLSIFISNTDSTTQYTFRIQKNAGTTGETTIAPMKISRGTGGNHTFSIFRDVSLEEGDTVEIQSSQNSGGSVTVRRTSRLSIRKVC